MQGWLCGNGAVLSLPSCMCTCRPVPSLQISENLLIIIICLCPFLNKSILCTFMHTLRCNTYEEKLQQYVTHYRVIIMLYIVCQSSGKSNCESKVSVVLVRGLTCRSSGNTNPNNKIHTLCMRFTIDRPRLALYLRILLFTHSVRVIAMVPQRRPLSFQGRDAGNKLEFASKVALL